MSKDTVLGQFLATGEPAAAERAPIKTLNATKGGLLQAITGDKTINIGYTKPTPGFAFLRHPQNESLRVPVIIERSETVDYAQISEDKARHLGFSSKDRMTMRLVDSAVANSPRQQGGDSNSKVAKEALVNSHVNLVHYRLATPAEIEQAGHDPQAIRREMGAMVDLIFHDHDETVDRALTKLGMGEQALRVELDRSIEQQFITPGRGGR